MKFGEMKIFFNFRDHSFTNDIQITITIQQRNGKKAWTIVTGLEMRLILNQNLFLKTLF